MYIYSNLLIYFVVLFVRNVTPKNILNDCIGSLKRLDTDYLDVYQVRSFPTNKKTKK